ncbi:hypothetical protein E6Q11_00700 [Candidatus Dojkabacteria bacterium]|uniref:Baseplate protein J-like barrel domain-containing protein n=1 Tax=Candidatus Dojkabacteria bacterium TaxID=2099670 RepID=A0A5C7JB37_9BACT|nr:MAG: hypothetical protein E6Q11_00700 [Candidatus Dojkabacteria bacterium]
MKLPKLPSLEKKTKTKEYYLSLVLRDEKASAVVFEEENSRVNVVGEHEEHFKTSLNEVPEEELLDVLDKTVSGAERNLPPDTESQKTIFGVNQDWISEDGKIKTQYLTKLIKISDELEFKPMGFLVIPEAVVHLLAKEEGQPISGILTEINNKSLNVYLVKAGKIIETKSSPIEGPIPETVDKLLQHSTTTEILPSRIIIFNGGDEKLQQEFIAHKWSKALPFLHVPQITNLAANYDARSVLNGTATQMGLSVFEPSLSKAVKEDKAEILAGEKGEAVSTEEVVDEDKTLAEAANEFGFSAEDVKAKDKPLTAVEDDLMPRKGAKSDNINTDNITAADQFKEIPEEVKISNSDSQPLSMNAAAISTGMKSTFAKLKIGSIFKGGGGKNPKILLAATIPLVLLLLIGYLYLFGRSATVNLSLDQRDETKTEDITFSEDEATNAKDNIMAARFITVSEDGKTETAATGKKETGDKAKGTVTLFNSDTSGGKTIPAGTTITSSNDLSFETEKAVTIASASGDIFSGTEPGKADVAVTAEKFGTNYNLPSGTKFSVEGTSSVAAKNDKAFSGGTKKDIKVVSKKDIEKLTKDLEEQLKSSAADDIRKQASGYEVLPDFISVEFDKKSFSKDVDDEADNVSLTGVINYKGVAYKKSEAASYANEKFKNNDDLSVNEDSVEITVEDLEEDDGEATGKATIKAGLLPQIDKEKITQDIKGKSLTDARSKILGMPGIKDVEIKISLGFLPLPKTLPFRAGKITISANQ